MGVELHQIGEQLCAALLNHCVAAQVPVEVYAWSGAWNKGPLPGCRSESGDEELWRFAWNLEIVSEGERFDGMHRVDVVAISAVEAMALEAKLGKTQHGKTGVDQLLLGGDAGRWGVPQILQDRLARRHGTEIPLSVRADGRLLPVRAGWGVILRRSVFEGWLRNGTPKFRRYPFVIVFEDLGVGVGREAFNGIVNTVIGAPDYYTTWVDSSVDDDLSSLS